ncbi:MAG: hypothetical protein JRI34_09035 [Deltaproteobacteria bacterium]|nr:hypothetical protein [Deltaproteobacteria bacterium]
MSDHCTKHPDRPSVITCFKMNFGYCQECLDTCEACTEPCGYCKHRRGCVIYELCRKSEKAHRLREECESEA